MFRALTRLLPRKELGSTRSDFDKEKTVNRANSRVAVSAITAVAVLLVAAAAFVGTSVQQATPLGHELHSHAHPRFSSLPLGLEALATSPRPGSTLRGGEIVSHFEGRRGATLRQGTAGGRTLYTGVTAYEPTLGIDKKGNIFYQGAERGTGYPEPVVVVSADGGRSWDDVTPEGHGFTQDPYIYVDRDTGRVFADDMQVVGAPCHTVSHSDDFGKSWTTSQTCGIVDHQTVFSGPPVSSSTIGYPNVLYMCAIDGGLGSPFSTMTSCLKSLDGGTTWVRTGEPAYPVDPAEEGNAGAPGWCEGGTGHGVADTKGVLYLPRGWCGQPYLAISKDEGSTWKRIQVADIGMPLSMSTYCVNTCRDFPFYQHEAGVAVDAAGNIYYFWVARDRLPYLAVSTDKGKSFSKPRMIGPPGLKEAWGPKIEVGGNGKIAFAYLGSTNAPGGKAPEDGVEEYTEAVTWNGYITTSVNALASKPRFFTASVNDPSDPLIRGACSGRCGAQFDFIDVAIGPDGRPYTSMVDGCPAPGKKCVGFGSGIVGTVVGGPRLR